MGLRPLLLLVAIEVGLLLALFGLLMVWSPVSALLWGPPTAAGALGLRGPPGLADRGLDETGTSAAGPLLPVLSAARPGDPRRRSGRGRRTPPGGGRPGGPGPPQGAAVGPLVAVVAPPGGRPAPGPHRRRGRPPEPGPAPGRPPPRPCQRGAPRGPALPTPQPRRPAPRSGAGPDGRRAHPQGARADRAHWNGRVFGLGRCGIGFGG